MDSKTNQHSLNHLHKIQTPSVIKTSKNWVLPPRPRPGRKPNANTKSPSTCSTTGSSSGSPPAQILSLAAQDKPKKTYKKKAPKTTQQDEVLSQISNNPVELALQQIKNENKLLKLELSKLVSDLKSLQQQQEMEMLHKKRNHVEMESVSSDDFLLDQLIDSGSDEDDSVSQISTPSLISSTSSFMLHSSSSLSSIQEDQVLKLDDFLTTSYFDGETSNSISSTKTTVKPMKSTLVTSPMLSPPSLPMNDHEENFQFKFLEQEKPTVNTNSGSNFGSLFDMASTESTDMFNWEWQ